MKLQALLLSLIITTGAAMAQGNITTCEVKPTDIHVVSKEDWEQNKVIAQQANKLDNVAVGEGKLAIRVAALEKKVSSLIKIVKMLQARVGTK